MSEQETRRADVPVTFLKRTKCDLTHKKSNGVDHLFYPVKANSANSLIDEAVVVTAICLCILLSCKAKSHYLLN